MFGCDEKRFRELVCTKLKYSSKYQFQTVDDAPMICEIGNLIVQATIPKEVIEEEIKVEAEKKQLNVGEGQI